MNDSSTLWNQMPQFVSEQFFSYFGWSKTTLPYWIRIHWAFFIFWLDQKLLCHIGSEPRAFFIFWLNQKLLCHNGSEPTELFSYFGLIRNYSAILDQNPLSNIFRTIHILFQLKWLYGFLNRRFFFHISSNQKHY